MFIEKFQQDASALESGIGTDDLIMLSHEPPLISREGITSLSEQIKVNQENSYLGDYFKKIQELLYFGVSPKLKLKGFTAQNSFIEIFDEVKKTFAFHQILIYSSILCQKLKRAELQSKLISILSEILDITLTIKSEKELYHQQGAGKWKNLRIGVKIEQNKLLISIDPRNGNIDFLMEPYNNIINIHKRKFKVYSLQITMIIVGNSDS